MTMESPATADTVAMGVKLGGADNSNMLVTKSLDNIVGNLWQARQESSGSSMGNQSPRRGEDLSDPEGDVDPASPDIEEDDKQQRSSSQGEEDSGHMNGSGPEDVDRDRGGGGGVRLKDPRDLIKDVENMAAGVASSLGGDKDVAKAILAGLPGFPGLEAFRHRDLMSNSQSAALLSAAAAGLRTPPSSLFPPHAPSPGAVAGASILPPPGTPPSVINRPPSTPGSQRSGGGSSPISTNNNNSGSFGTSQQNWSFEEQFKQLYEIDDNPKRKEFLDELFSFMQRKGTPINRLPIMAKQVLDLFELYNLVIARGGLVEVINKKLWQEVIKGLGLPSSITSAAFTLRTQYSKYLYPYECEKMNLSNQNELQAAIEGNKREGRRSSYGTYPDLGSSLGVGPLPPSHPLAGPHPSLAAPFLPPRSGAPSLPGLSKANFGNGALPGLAGSRSPPPLTGESLSALERTRLALWKMYNQNAPNPPTGLPNIPVSLPSLPTMPSLPNLPSLPTDLFNMSVNQHQGKRPFQSGDNDDDIQDSRRDRADKLTHDRDSSYPEDRPSLPPSRPGSELRGDDLPKSPLRSGSLENGSLSPPPAKRAHLSPLKEREVSPPVDEEEEEEAPAAIGSNGYKTKSLSAGALPGANIKITSRDGAGGDSSLVVSMEINGISYQGVLFAQQVKARAAS